MALARSLPLLLLFISSTFSRETGAEECGADDDGSSLLMLQRREGGLQDKSNETGLFDTYFSLPLCPWFWMCDIPGVPFQIDATVDTALRLLKRFVQIAQPLAGLQHEYSIKDTTATSAAYMYGKDFMPNSIIVRIQETLTVLQGVPANADFPTKKNLSDYWSREPTPTEVMPLTELSLTHPNQFAMSWTAFGDVYKRSKEKTDEYSLTLEVSNEGVEAATKAFFYQIATSGVPFNLILPQKVGPDRYIIDLRVFEELKEHKEENDVFWRFTPAVKVTLRQDKETKNLIPYKIVVSGYQGRDKQVYEKDTASNGGWMYALQAAKTAVSVWGIWYGHVYKWHLVTAAMQMTLLNYVSPDHPVRKLLAPMSKYLIGFDALLLFVVPEIAPPTSVKNGEQLLQAENIFAKGRKFFDDDPKQTLENLGISEEDFTVTRPWDGYITVKYLLEIWDSTEEYVTTYVTRTWPTGQDVVRDKSLSKWLKKSGDRFIGNVRGLPRLDDAATAQEELIKLLTSLLYRITAHGSGRMDAGTNPAHSFVANFPPTLQKRDIPSPDVQLSTGELLTYLPKTGTLGSMQNFIFAFIFSPPYESFIPTAGIDKQLFFGDNAEEPMNQALIKWRGRLAATIKDWFIETPGHQAAPTYSQWPRNVET